RRSKTKRSKRRQSRKAEAFFRPRLELLEDRHLLSTFTVMNANDSGPGSLRQAILDSNAATGGTNTIAFNIPSAGVHTIIPVAALPTITNPVIIDGTTEGINVPGGSIELDGASAGATANGFEVQAGSSTIKGLTINRFAGNGILLDTKGGDTVQGCF